MIILGGKNDVATPNKAYAYIKPTWDLFDDLLGGTQTMRNAKTKWLPREPLETYESYLARLEKTFLYPGFKRTIRSFVGKPFGEDLTVNKAVTGKNLEYLNDFDRQGNDISIIAAQAFEIGLAKGVVHFLNLYPRTPSDRRLTIAEAERDNIRPYTQVVDPVNLIGWQYIIDHGKVILTQIRVREIATVQVGQWGEENRTRIRVYERIVVDGKPIVAYTLYEEQPSMTGNGTDWQIIDKGDITLPVIPLVTVYFGKKICEMIAEPPLEDLAWLNVEHWQSSSDQRHILHVARVPLWFLSGWQPEVDDETGEAKDKVEIGPDRMIRVQDPNADLKVVEHTGKAIEAGRQDLKDIESRMAAVGAELLSKKTGKGDTTATEADHDNKSEDSDLKSMAKRMEDGLTNCINFHYQWVNEQAPSGKLVHINRDFSLTAQDASDLQFLQYLDAERRITHKTTLEESKRRGVLASSVNIDQELTAAKQEAKDNPPSSSKAPAIQQKAGAGA